MSLRKRKFLTFLFQHVFFCALIAYRLIRELCCGFSDSSGSQSSVEVSIFYRILHSRNMRFNFVQILLNVRGLFLYGLRTFYCLLRRYFLKRNNKLDQYGGCIHHIKISLQVYLIRLYLEFLRLSFIQHNSVYFNYDQFWYQSRERSLFDIIVTGIEHNAKAAICHTNVRMFNICERKCSWSGAS